MLLIIGCNSKISKFIKGQFNKESLLLSDKRKGFDYLINLEKIEDIYIDPRITHAIIFAGITNIEFCNKNSKLANFINGENTLKLIKLLNKKDIKVLFPSSTCVFPSNSLNKNYEDSDTHGDNIYGQIKANVEKSIKNNRLNTILRISKVITPDDKLLTMWKEELTNNRQINPFYDLRIAPISVFTLAEFIYKWFLEDFSGIAHLSPSSDMTYKELAMNLCTFLSAEKSLVKPKSISNLKNKNIYNPMVAYLSCKSSNSKELDLKNEVKIIFRSLI